MAYLRVGNGKYGCGQWPDGRSRCAARRSCGRPSTRWRGSALPHTRVADVRRGLGVSTGAGLLPLRVPRTRCSRRPSPTPPSATSSGSTRPRNGTGSAGRRLAPDPHDVRPRGSAPGWTLWIDAWAAASAQPGDGGGARGLDVRWKDTVAWRSGRASPTARSTCADPDGAAWRITALLDGLAVQVTVHNGVIPRRSCRAGCAEAAAAELGVDPRRRSPDRTISHQPARRVRRRRPAPAGPARRRDVGRDRQPPRARSASTPAERRRELEPVTRAEPDQQRRVARHGPEHEVAVGGQGVEAAPRRAGSPTGRAAAAAMNAAAVARARRRRVDAAACVGGDRAAAVLRRLDGAPRRRWGSRRTTGRPSRSRPGSRRGANASGPPGAK